MINTWCACTSGKFGRKHEHVQSVARRHGSSDLFFDDDSVLLLLEEGRRKQERGRVGADFFNL